MITESQIEEILLERFGDLEIKNEPAGLYEPLKYMISIGGKRVRPRLCLLVYGLFKDSFEEGILSAAEALEVFHSFTLAHDDIMDKSCLRRGKPTVWSKWDENTAILSGDVTCIDSYRRIAKVPAAVLPQVLKLFTTTAMEVCEGQQFDMDFEGEESVPMSEYIKMIGLKTAVLIACSAKMGALVAGQDESTCDQFYKYGYNLGLAFQIADDYLDTFGDTVVFGKPIGGDILNGKKTWLLTKAMEKIDDKRTLLDAMNLPCDTEEQKNAKIDAVRKIYLELGIDEDAKYEIIRYHASAMEYITSLDLGNIRTEMVRRYADRLVGRNY